MSPKPLDLKKTGKTMIISGVKLLIGPEEKTESLEDLSRLRAELIEAREILEQQLKVVRTLLNETENKITEEIRKKIFNGKNKWNR